METANLSKRERQIMDIVYRRGSATAGEVQTDLNHGQNPDELNNSTVRTLIRILEEKGHLRHEVKGKQFLYFPTIPREQAVKSALRSLLDTFFNNSPEAVVAALLENESLTDSDLDKITALIEKARQEGR
ncbi:MAG TPA: BlaI/MecI/CopY family transcriptional regulator [Bacillota bacterium]|nr:BlaI/MecI/CopY family transcriptional regulator [Bacillota bacterium]